ncbi:MAG: hypothetical protein ACKVIH_04545 [Burkholderiales bacterium]
MDTTHVLLHLANFFAPALFLAVCVTVLARFFMPKRPKMINWPAGLAIQLVVGAVVLLAGLALFGTDAKMATYAALVVCSGLTQWLLLRGWRK